MIIADPNIEKVIIPYDGLLTDYRSVGGSWTHTYLTQVPKGEFISHTIDRQLIERAESLIPMMFHGGGATYFNTPTEPNIYRRKPHDLYIVDFESLRNRISPKVTKVGIRIIDFIKKSNVIFEYDNNTKDANIQQIIHARGYTRFYFDTLNWFINENKNSPNSFELRVISQPELNVEAFWLHNRESDKKDVFVSVLQTNLFNDRTIYSYDELFQILGRLANSTELYNDELLGD